MNVRDNILIIDDEHDIRVALRDWLEVEGYRVYSAANGRAGLEVLNIIEKPALILLDLMMPILTGEDFLKAIKSSDTFASIPVVVISANPGGADTRGAEVCLTKPLDLDLLLRVIEKYCQPSQPRVQFASQVRENIAPTESLKLAIS